ncbi:AcrR family transcriptional regulator [Nonomuraea thailandensis]|uniref:AcrR family transcriptional regulator n=1 Tax=Nonomuraea thailandensis TaxID=1188745 RepID=A0A9X2GMN8_9ACTN|nr:TetR/AcrR family transcriptional regulator [Nonomuraea thailandensis]MCP2361686.1 AcrR family transcriptional regulator [Nonomuraea thailandensis]
MRADAQRNRDLLVAAAAQVFAERGADAPLDDVARRAGIGNATLYRHFPTRSDLLLAVYADEVSQLCSSAETLREEAGSPREALHEWLRLFMDHVEGKRDLALADTAQVADWHRAMLAAASSLLADAVRVEAVRADLDVRDLLTLVKGITVAAEDRRQAERLLSLVNWGP